MVCLSQLSVHYHTFVGIPSLEPVPPPKSTHDPGTPARDDAVRAITPRSPLQLYAYPELRSACVAAPPGARSLTRAPSARTPSHACNRGGFLLLEVHMWVGPTAVQLYLGHHSTYTLLHLNLMVFTQR